MSRTLTNRGGPPNSVLPLSTPGRPTGTAVGQQGTDLSLRATANGLARVVDELERKGKEIALEIGHKEETIQKLEEDVKEKKAELGPLEEMLEKWAKKKT